MKPIAIGLTAGDPNGIGPEVALRTALQPQPANRRLVLIGHRSVWERAAAQLGRACPPEIATLEPPLPRRSTWDPDMAPPPLHRPEHPPGLRRDGGIAGTAQLRQRLAKGVRSDRMADIPTRQEQRAGFDDEDVVHQPRPPMLSAAASQSNPLLLLLLTSRP